MAFEDVQMDALLRRYARQKNNGVTAEHLDADELNAFAEGSLPAAARPQYVAHLADCDDCRQLVSQLAMAAGAVSKTSEAQPSVSETRSWSQRLAGLFKVPVLRYVAFAAVLVTVIGLGVLVTRQRQEPTLVARNESENQHEISAIKPQQPAAESNAEAPTTSEQPAAKSDQSTLPKPGPTSNPSLDSQPSKSGDQPAQPPKPATGTETAKLADKPEEPAKGQPQPSYAPPPPREATEQAKVQSERGIAPQSVPYQKSQGRAQTGENKLDERNQEVASRGSGALQSTSAARAPSDRASGPRKDVDNVYANRTVNENRAEKAKNEGLARDAKKESDESASEERSVGGHKFHRQGNSWVDAKYKSSMSLKSIVRGSEEFASLDSGLRSIAQQLSGELIVVWKGKAYQIR